MIADLHAHYAMHLDPGVRGNLLRLARTRRGRLRLRDYLRALGVNLASQFANYPSLGSGPRLRMPYMVQGGVGVALSVLYSFFDEFDPGRPRGDDYLDEILRQAELVERHVREKHADRAVVATTPAELAAADGKVALVHCVEGAFHLLGDSDTEVERAVDRLADRGVAYITVAHLIWRGLATAANAFPMLSEEQFARRCKQPDVGLTSRGEAAIRAMVRRHVIIDLSHMSEQAMRATLDLLDHELDPGRQVPVYYTHGACRLDGRQQYNLSEAMIRRIADRDGVIGLIMAEHQLYDGLPAARRKDFGAAMTALRTHIDTIRDITGSHRHAAIGTDFDGFIKPTLAGLRDARDLRKVEAKLHRHYGADAELLCFENGVRPLRTYWRGRPVL